MKNQKTLKGKVTSQSAEEIAKIEKENLFSKYIYAPPTSYKTVHLPTVLTDKLVNRNTHPTMKDISDSCVNVDDCKLMDEGISEVPQKDSACNKSQDSSKSNLSGSTSSMGAFKNGLNETLDDFQECEMGNRVKCKLAQKSREDSSFICIMCQGDFTHLTLDERTMHVNQCIDYHSSAVATSQVVPSPTLVLECPLCFKSLPSIEVRKSHVKKCGKSRGLSVQSVIQAIHLQEKHALERKALGLPLNVKAKPVKPPKKPAMKKFTLEPKSTMQSDLQLAKALSLSLKQKESQSQLTILPTSSGDVSMGVLKAPAEFQNPGRPPPKKKKRIAETPLLLLRTEEERKKIIQDKVDAIIVSSPKDENNIEGTEHEKSTAKEHNPAYLWNLSNAAVDKNVYYVEQLLDWIKPSDVEVGSKLCNLSQVPGHRIFTQLPCDYMFSCANKNNETDVTVEGNSAPSLTSSLRSLIGNSWMSDVDIHTASGIAIPAHKLFLALRCPGLKNAFDVPIECGKYILNWENTSFDAALHFLNFIYTGSTEWKEEIIGELTQLAKKYKVEDLTDILNDSETLELLINEDPETEKPADTPMNNDICGKDDSITVDYQNSKQDHILCLKDDTIVYSTDKKHSPSKDKDLKKSSDFDVQSEIENECTFIKMNNFSHSPPTNNFMTTCDTNKTFLETPEVNFINIKTHDSDLEACITNSDSSNDSCKILRDTTFSEFKASPIASCEISVIKNQMSPKISPEKRATTSYISLKTYLEQSFAENVVSPDYSYSNNCKSGSKGSYNSDHEELISSKVGDNVLDNSNEDIVIVNEFTDKSDSINKRNSSSFNETLPLETDRDSSRKLSSFSSVFQNEYEDLDAAICLSQNTSFQNQFINRLGSCANKRESIACKKNSYASPEKLHFNQNYDKQHFDSNISPVKNNSFHIESNEIDCFDYNECEMNIVSSPEIFVCDSGDENTDHVLGSDYFRSYESISKNRSSSPAIDTLRKSFQNEVVEKENLPDDRFHCSTSINWADKTKLKSPIEENDDVFCDTFRDQNTSEKKSVVMGETSTFSFNKSPNKSSEMVPELICCDSNSDDKLEVIECLQTSKSNKKMVLENEEDDCISILPDYKTIQQETPKTRPCKNSLLSSPESPWTFKTDKPSEDFGFSKKSKSCKSSTVSSQLHSNLEFKYSERKDNNTLDKNKCNKISDSSVNTPKDLVKYKISDSPITPLPDYGKMMTPEIKEALKRIGVKALPRKKAVAVLSHVYDETHPWNDGASGSNIQDLESASQSKSKSQSQKKNLSVPKKRKETTEICTRETKKRVRKCSSTVQSENEFQDKPTKKTTKSSGSLHNKRTDSSGSQKDIPLWDTSPESLRHSSFGSNNSRDGVAHNLSISSELSDSGLTECKGNTELLRNYILSKEELYNRILNYMPVNLLEFQQELKENGIKISLKQLTDYFDEQCITFTYPRKEEYKKKQQVRTQRFRKRVIAKLSQQASSNLS